MSKTTHGKDRKERKLADKRDSYITCLTVDRGTYKRKSIMKLFYLYAAIILNLSLSPALGQAQDFIPEQPFTERLPAYEGQPWFWAYGMRMPSQNDGQAYLFDETGKRLGQLSTGFWFNSLLNAHKRNEIVTVETYFSRGLRGERTDVVSLYDERTLAFKKEIIIPPKRMHGVKNNGFLRLSDDERFALVVNYTPAQSVSVVDLDRGVFIEEIETPGCATLYGAGNRDFYAICGNGSFMHIKLDENGRLVKRTRSKPLFNAVDDFLTISASRIGDVWYFVSRQYNVYAIRMAGNTIELVDKWSLVSDAEREDKWTIAGMDHTAAHIASNTLYVMMHQGDAHQFEEPATHVWVYDTQTGKKLHAIDLEEVSAAIKVSQDETPRLYTLNFHFPMPQLFALWIYLVNGETALFESARQRIGVYDALSGGHLFFSDLIPHGGFVMQVQPW